MKVISIKKESIIFIICIGIILSGLINSLMQETKPTFFMPLSNKIIIIDAGHGGWDPGKIAQDNILEKDLNLKVAKKVQQYLEQSGAFVLMTRTKDEALGNIKVIDMKTRREITDASQADMLISIHQNAHTKKSANGAQVFYYNNSTSGKRLAEAIQEQIKKNTDQNQKRSAKTNSSYYILKNIKIPSVIIECGFLSNDNDLEKLINDDYQNKISWAIYLGIIDYYNKK
jgi:N-acetylmuramoyl-L-alanine amidase